MNTQRRPGRARTPLANRLWSKVRRSAEADGCWEFDGCRLPWGYGCIGRGGAGGRVEKAHRIAWELTHGPIPSGMLVCHRCDNPPCCRPDHLFLGTDRDNCHDMLRKGRKRQGVMSRKKISRNDAVDIRALAAFGATRSTLGREYDLSPGTLSQIINGRTWKVLP